MLRSDLTLAVRYNGRKQRQKCGCFLFTGYLPADNKPRELKSRTLVSCQAANIASTAGE